MSAPPSPDSQLQQLDQDTTLEPVQSLNSKLDRLLLPDMATEAPIAVATGSMPASTVNEEKRWTYLDNIRKNPGPFSDPDVAGTPEAFEQFDKMKVL
ncbi:hypothetical protein COL940_000540 [Colletotrichum noveboracense]|nr:hypothetical protein COL940_000540 [Colletotrichum noveboracense]